LRVPDIAKKNIRILMTRPVIRSRDIEESLYLFFRAILDHTGPVPVRK
jgi:hypothetical protein